MIEPSVGRIVLFHHEASAPGEPPHAAIVIGVQNERSVNLACFTPEGTYYHRLEAQLLQDDDAPPPEGAGYAEWMAFQKGQAVKHDAESGLHPRIAALEQVLTTGGPMHQMFVDLQEAVDGKLQELEQRLTTQTTTAPAPLEPAPTAPADQPEAPAPEPTAEAEPEPGAPDAASQAEPAAQA
jgi:hypothetical protein